MAKSTVLEEFQQVEEISEISKKPSVLPRSTREPSGESEHISYRVYPNTFFKEHFLRSEAWVSDRKTALKEIWIWDLNVMFEGSNFTQVGFDRFQDLYDQTANTFIETDEQTGKRKSTRKDSKTFIKSLTEFKMEVWRKNYKSLSGSQLDEFEEYERLQKLRSGQSDNARPSSSSTLAVRPETQSVTYNVGVAQGEFVDSASEIAEQTDEIIETFKDVSDQNKLALRANIDTYNKAEEERLFQLLIAPSLAAKARADKFKAELLGIDPNDLHPKVEVNVIE